MLRAFRPSNSAVETEIHNSIINYIQNSLQFFTNIRFGTYLSEEIKRKRFIFFSLLNKLGFDMEAYRREFHEDAMVRFPELI